MRTEINAAVESYVIYEHDALNRVTDVYDHDSTQVPVDPDTWFKDVSVVPTQMQYNPLGQMTSISRPNDIDSSYIYGDASIAVDVSRNQNPYQVYSIVHQDTETTPVTLGQYDYSYDAAGNRTGMNVTASDGSQTNISYDYDRANRLIEESYLLIGGATSTTNYAYDRAGNRSQMTDSSGDITQYIYDANDQLTRVNLPDFYFEDYTYDARGNLTLVESSGHATYSATNYAYNARDQLISFGIGGATAITYDYDYRGNRVEQNIGGAVTDYLWDEFSRYGDVILETDPNNPLDVVSYTLANGMLISQNNNGNVDYFLQDAQNSTVGIADDTGTVTSTYSYNAFGELDSDPLGVETNYLYTGQQFDVNTELYSLRARYYDPGMGRFLTRDTWVYDYGNPIELNRYGYTANNPATYSDPSGYTTAPSTASLGLMNTVRNFSISRQMGYAIGGLVLIAVLGILAATVPDITDVDFFPESVEVETEGLVRAWEERLGRGNGSGGGGNGGSNNPLWAIAKAALATATGIGWLLCVLLGCAQDDGDPDPNPTEEPVTATPAPSPQPSPTPDDDDTRILYHGTLVEIVGGQFSLEQSIANQRDTHYTDTDNPGIFFTDNLHRAIQSYSGGQWVVRVEMPKSVADPLCRMDPSTNKPEWVFRTPIEIAYLNATMEIKRAASAFKDWMSDPRSNLQSCPSF